MVKPKGIKFKQTARQKPSRALSCRPLIFGSRLFNIQLSLQLIFFTQYMQENRHVQGCGAFLNFRVLFLEKAAYHLIGVTKSQHYKPPTDARLPHHDASFNVSFALMKKSQQGKNTIMPSTITNEPLEGQDTTHYSSFALFINLKI